MELADISKLNQYAFYLDDLCTKEHLMMDKFINANCLQNKSIVPIYEAIPIDQYETRLKADMVAMLEELDGDIEFDAIGNSQEYIDGANMSRSHIQQKINELKENKKWKCC